MRFCLFLQFDQDVIAAPIAAPDRGHLEDCLNAIPGVCTALLHEATDATDPILARNTSPRLVVQLYFQDLAALEAAAPLAILRNRALVGTRISQQAMLVRPFPVPAPGNYVAGEQRCTYLIAYRGEADDLNAWLSHYLDRHIPLMARLPGIREIEVYTRIDWCSALPIPRATCMQRNKVVFDSPAALEQAFASPVRREMRRDFECLPPFRGDTTHDPMLTRQVPARSGGNSGSR